jgi:hypothetical protein
VPEVIQTRKGNYMVQLSQSELDRLEQLENEQARGVSVRWDVPKVVKGFLVRPIEEVEVPDYNDKTRRVTKKIATLRTASGLEAIWEGPVALEPLFEVVGSGHPIIVRYGGRKPSQTSAYDYGDFSVIVGPPGEVEYRSAEQVSDAPAYTDPDEALAAGAEDDDIPF